MKKAIFSLLLWGYIFVVGNAQTNRPNIIFFLVDDMGWQDCSVPFWKDTTRANRKFRTPAMERLAAEGMKFTQAYAHSICTPSRVSLLTGMNTARHRVTNWTMNKNTPTDATDDTVFKTPAWNVNGLSPTDGVENTVYATPLPKLLQDAGYYTILIGKAHFGASQTIGANPLQLGFSKNVGGSAAGNPSSYYGEKNYGNTPGKYNIRGVPGLEKFWGSATFLTEALTLEAIKAMDTAVLQQQPFFLYMAQYAVHLPFDADPRFIGHYPHLPPEEAAYAALVEGMDKSLGDLMGYLQRKGLADNTILIFLSDNGGYAREPRMGAANTQNYPLRAGKGSLFEGGIRVPMLVKWPGITRAGAVSQQYVAIQDLFPTVLEMAGVMASKTVQPVDGQTIVPFIRNAAKKDNKKTLLWHYPNKWVKGSKDDPDDFTSWTSAIRQGDWKLIYYYRSKHAALYNLRKDIGEQTDLSPTYPKKAKKMLGLLTFELKRNKAQLPVVLATGLTVPYPKIDSK